ncbi:MAG: hypothetical protein IKE20_03160 [Eggerthellaceae bacterium]|nr:hypothetical protein [Eggerthellaceae bacterium]
MIIPDKYRERYDNLARSHPWMREMRDELTNAINELQKEQPYCYDPEAPLDTLRTVGRYIDELQAERNEAIRAVKAAQDAMERARDERDEWKAKAEGSSKVRAGSSNFAQLFNENEWFAAMVRVSVAALMQQGEIDLDGKTMDEWLMSPHEDAHSKTQSKTGPSLTEQSVSLNDLYGIFGDENSRETPVFVENPQKSPENGVSSGDVDANDANAMQDSREKLVSMPYHNGEKQAKLMGRKFEQVITDELHIDEPDTIRNELEDNGQLVPEPDSREKLEAALDNIISDALRNLRRAIYQCVEQRMDVLSFSDGEFIDFEHEEFVGEYVGRAMKVLDMQAAMTERECESICHGCVTEQAGMIARLRAENDEQKELLYDIGLENAEQRARIVKLTAELNATAVSLGAAMRDRDELQSAYDEMVRVAADLCRACGFSMVDASGEVVG